MVVLQGIWQAHVTLRATDHIEYKYACYSDKEGRCVGYEQGVNRTLYLPHKLKQARSHHPTPDSLVK